MSVTQASPAPPRIPRIARPFVGLTLAVLAELGIAFFVLSVVSVPLIAVWVGIPMLLAVVPCVRWFANLHRTLEWTIRGRRGEKVPTPFEHPGILDGVAGMAFVEAAVASSSQEGAWVEVPKIG